MPDNISFAICHINALAYAPNREFRDFLPNAIVTFL
jgi:hypothetical protein